MLSGGFQSGFITESALLRVFNDVRLATDAGQCCWGAGGGRNGCWNGLGSSYQGERSCLCGSTWLLCSSTNVWRSSRLLTKTTPFLMWLFHPYERGDIRDFYPFYCWFDCFYSFTPFSVHSTLADSALVKCWVQRRCHYEMVPLALEVGMMIGGWWVLDQPPWVGGASQSPGLARIASCHLVTAVIPRWILLSCYSCWCILEQPALFGPWDVRLSSGSLLWNSLTLTLKPYRTQTLVCLSGGDKVWKSSGPELHVKTWRPLIQLVRGEVYVLLLLSFLPALFVVPPPHPAGHQHFGVHLNGSWSRSWCSVGDRWPGLWPLFKERGVLQR